MEQQPVVEVVKQPEEKVATVVEEVVTKKRPITELEGGYVEYQDKLYSKQALKDLNPNLFKIQPDDTSPSKTNFGTNFPKWARKGDIFVRVDMLPNKVYKFDGNRWIEINKQNTTAYMDDRYIEHLIQKIDSGELDTTHLTEQEEEQIRAYLDTQKR